MAVVATVLSHLGKGSGPYLPTQYVGYWDRLDNGPWFSSVSVGLVLCGDGPPCGTRDGLPRQDRKWCPPGSHGTRADSRPVGCTDSSLEIRPG